MANTDPLTVINLNITINSVQELKEYLKALPIDSSEGVTDLGVRTENTLEEAIEAAKLKKERYESFTYEDVGLPPEMRTERKALRDWAELNGIQVWQGNMPGVRGFQGTIFRPLRLDGNGHEIPAECPAEEQH